MEWILKLLRLRFTKWQLLETYHFNTSWYVIQVRQNIDTGYKQFKCSKIINYAYSTDLSLITTEKIESALTEI